MDTRQGRQSIVFGGLLILFGAAGLAEVYYDLSTWAWIGLLGAAGLFTFVIYLSERSDWGLLIPVYALWSIALLLIGIELGFLGDPFITFYVLAAIAIPFLVVYLRDNRAWWALIPAYVMLAIGALVTLNELGILSDALIATFVLISIALPFYVVFFRDRAQWWYLVPAYVLTAIGIMVGLIETGLLADLLIPAYVMLAIALPFYAVYALNRENWWALIPAGIMTLIAAGFLFAEDLAVVFVPIVLILVGVWILIQQLRSRS